MRHIPYTTDNIQPASHSVCSQVYRITRRVQGRLNDLMLVVAAHAERDPATNDATLRALGGIEVQSRAKARWDISFF